MRGLEYFELKDLDADSLSLLNSILCEEEASSDATDHGGAGEEAGLKIPHTAGKSVCTLTSLALTLHINMCQLFHAKITSPVHHME